MRVLVQLRPTEPPAFSLLATPELEQPVTDLAPLARAGAVVDEEYPTVVLPAARAEDDMSGLMRLSLGHTPEFSFEPEDVSSVVRCSIPDGDDGRTAVTELLAQPDVMGVFGDPVIASTLTCVGDPPVGDADDVARKLDCARLLREGLSGDSVRVAVVDSGINNGHLMARGHNHTIDVANSFNPTGVVAPPGAHPVHHGTMCAYDVGIAAPDAILLDHALLRSRAPGRTAIEGLLSDAVRSFSQLRALLLSEGDPKPLVVNNSWGVFDPASDFPPGHPGNYTDNPAHPFNLITASLESAGADVLFAAGNCGRDCPDGRCRFRSLPICGANSHPAVLSVGGIDVNDQRVGYSSQGPGRLAADKPDLCSYTHFLGSEAFGAGEPDSGTSAACPVAAGVVAAIRTRVRPTQVSPAQLRALMFRTATDLGVVVGFDHDHGWGALSPPELMDQLAGATI